MPKAQIAVAEVSIIAVPGSALMSARPTSAFPRYVVVKCVASTSPIAVVPLSVVAGSAAQALLSVRVSDLRLVEQN